MSDKIGEDKGLAPFLDWVNRQTARLLGVPRMLLGEPGSSPASGRIGRLICTSDGRRRVVVSTVAEHGTSRNRARSDDYRLSLWAARRAALALLGL